MNYPFIYSVLSMFYPILLFVSLWSHQFVGWPMKQPRQTHTPRLLVLADVLSIHLLGFVDVLSGPSLCSVDVLISLSDGPWNDHVRLLHPGRVSLVHAIFIVFIYMAADGALVGRKSWPPVLLESLVTTFNITFTIRPHVLSFLSIFVYDQSAFISLLLYDRDKVDFGRVYSISWGIFGCRECPHLALSRCPLIWTSWLYKGHSVSSTSLVRGPGGRLLALIRERKANAFAS